MVVSRRGGRGEGKEEEGVFRVGGIEEGLRMLQQRGAHMDAAQERGKDTTTDTTTTTTTTTDSTPDTEQQQQRLGRVFVIGGADIYKLALGMECCERILWTRIQGQWECDVFFPGGVISPEGDGRGQGEGGGGGGGGDGQGDKGKWVRRSREEMERWVGEEGVGGVRREGGVEFEVCMFERVR